MAASALLLIDIQNDYFEEGSWPLFNMSNAAVNAAKLLKSARDNGTIVVHIRHEFPTADAPFFRPGSRGAEISEVVAPLAHEKVIVKNHINAFKETDLKDYLDEHQVKEVTICGAMTHICIDAATRAAADFGYKVTTVHDACASRDSEFHGITVPAVQVHASFMSALAFGYATVVSTDQLLSKLVLTTVDR